MPIGTTKKIFNIASTLINLIVLEQSLQNRVIRKIKIKKLKKKRKSTMLQILKSKLEVLAKNGKNFYNRRYRYNHGKLYLKKKSTNIFVTLHTYLKGLVAKYWSGGTVRYRGRSRRKELAHAAISKLIPQTLVKKNLRDIHIYFFNKWSFMSRKHILPYLSSRVRNKKIRYRTLHLNLRISRIYSHRSRLIKNGQQCDI
jgi:hypothetical protein